MTSEFIQQLTHTVIDRVNHNLKDNNKVVGLQLDLAWYDLVSNSHSAPVGKPTNFGARPGLPTSYPGWSGRTWIRYAKNPIERGSDPLIRTCLHTGTGGFGSYNGPWSLLHNQIFIARRKYNYISPTEYNELMPVCYSWDCRVFAEDFPEILELYRTESVFERLKNGNANQRQYSYRWEDPATLAADKLLIERLERMENNNEIYS